MRWLAVVLLLLSGCGGGNVAAPLTSTPAPSGRASPAPPTLPATPLPQLPTPTAVSAPSSAPLRPAAPVARPIRPPSRPAPVQAVPAPRVDWLVGPGISVHVGTYSDCTGRTWQIGVARDTCFTDRLYLQGHNPGAFTPVASYGVGVRMTYWDHAGRAHVLVVLARRIIRRVDGAPPLVPGAGSQLQTCDFGHADGSVDIILDASET